MQDAAGNRGQLVDPRCGATSPGDARAPLSSPPTGGGNIRLGDTREWLSGSASLCRLRYNTSSHASV